ncbi:MAG: RNA-binding cell elongation regulator Jag/EloR [Negativicoccus succinicivorans]|mgnify:CR=1 FL=1|uniref:RNA-binding cell elongation regulator Jag/EloR n=2 Tax=Negativicoccus succinicivorans TaxID=620903 RepID=UPI0029157F63|nr:RNA-binding cell elongation regulator Jag/EloR [Negativicoccus succinicivorans]MDU5395478.1 RNA-binding cell elongation regulator Jag/EloR [Negativicoccus succinicivorans]
MSHPIEFTGKTVEEATAKALAELQVARGEVNVDVLSEGSKGIFGIGAKDARILVTKLYGELTESEVDKEIAKADSIVPREELTEASKRQAKMSAGLEDATGIEVQNEAPVIETPATVEEEPQAAEETAGADVAENDDAVAETATNHRAQSAFSADEQAEVAQRAKAFLQSVTDAMGLDVMIEKRLTTERILLQLHGRGLGVLIGKHGKTLDSLQYLTNLAANQSGRGRYFVMLDVEDYRERRQETLESLAIRMASRVKRSQRPLVLEPMNAYERKIIHLTLQDDPDVYTKSEGELDNRHLVIHYKQ